MRCLSDHEFLINLDKSSLVPSRRLEHLGMSIDTRCSTLFLPPEKVQKTKLLAEEVIKSEYSSHATDQVDGHPDLQTQSTSMGRISYSPITDAPQAAPNKNLTKAEHTCSRFIACQTISPMVDQGQQPAPGEDVRNSTGDPAVYRCQSDRLGSDTPQHTGRGPVVSTGISFPNKRLGAEGNSPSITTFQRSDLPTISSHMHGQYLSKSIHKQPGGGVEVLHSPEGGITIAEVGRSSSDQHESRTHQGDGKHASRLA